MVLVPDGADFTEVQESDINKVSSAGFQMNSPPSFKLAFVRVTLGTLFVTLLLVSASIVVRHCGVERGTTFPGIHQTAVDRHNSIIQQHGDIFTDLVGKWFVQPTNNWATVGIMNSQISFNITGTGGLMPSCQWYNYYVYSSWHLTMEVKNKGVWLATAQDPGVLKGFLNANHPVVILDYETDHIVLFAASTLLMPEGSLLVLSRNAEIHPDLHYRAQSLAKTYHIDLFQYTHIPQISSSTADFLYAFGDQTWKLALFSLLLFVTMSHLMPHDVTSLQSFSYSAIFSWNYGRDKFHLVLVSFCSYHQSWFAVFTHLTVLGDIIVWYPVVASWGDTYFVGLLVLQTLQLLSFKEPRFAVITFFTYLSFAILGYNLTNYEFYCRMLILASAVTKVAGHAAESFPPPLSGNEDFVSITQLRFPLQLKMPFVILFGIISEMGTGMPTRNFAVAYYILLCKLGYSSSRFMPLEKCFELDREIQKHGWKAYPDLKKAIESQTGYLQF